MCGIVGYVGGKNASPLLIEGLKRLEYRGYDSAGISTLNGKGLETRKAKGKISQLEAVMNGSPTHGTIGIAHTRWATIPRIRAVFGLWSVVHGSGRKST